MCPTSESSAALRCDGPGQIGELKVISYTQFMVAVDNYDGQVQWKDLPIAPKVDWRPWCFRGLAMASELVGDEDGECKECPWLTDCKKPKDGA